MATFTKEWDKIRENRPTIATLEKSRKKSLDIPMNGVMKLVTKLGAVILLLTFTMSSNERKKEFAVLRVVGASRKNISKRVPYVLELVGLEGREKRMPNELSGGEQQRVAIARALVNSPRMIVADEPTGNLDPVRSLELMLLFEKINEMGTTILVVTHAKELVNAFSKRVITLDDGHIISDNVDGVYFDYDIQ